jgi:hypothetical protein
VIDVRERVADAGLVERAGHCRREQRGANQRDPVAGELLLLGVAISSVCTPAPSATSSPPRALHAGRRLVKVRLQVRERLEPDHDWRGAARQVVGEAPDSLL